MIVSEVDSDQRYSFTIRSSDLTEENMNTVFTEISEEKVKGRLTGRIETVLDDGVKLKMNTRRRMFRVSYGGEDEAALAHAKRLAANLQERLESEPPRR